VLDNMPQHFNGVEAVIAGKISEGVFTGKKLFTQCRK